jgi:hypothetical protein
MAEGGNVEGSILRQSHNQTVLEGVQTSILSGVNDRLEAVIQVNKEIKDSLLVVVRTSISYTVMIVRIKSRDRVNTYWFPSLNRC